ncbi:MAG: hypothetical protein AB7D50_02165 [Bacilli bacterium]|nr:hypothetical protein [Bacilli bacterium]
MNKNKKLLLSSVGLAVLSGIAATGSTFAWFTTTRTATISYTSATVVSKQSNLKITYVSSNDTFDPVPETEAVSSLSLVGGMDITDISGDGLKFYKPVWSATENIASAINPVPVSESVGNWVEFTVTISRDNVTGMKVYLGAGTSITPKTANAQDLKAVAASRLAVINVDTPTSPVVECIYTPSDASHSYLTTAAAGTAVYGIDGYTKGTYEGDLVTGDLATQTTIGAADAAKTLVADLSTVDSADVTFRAWLEGEDTDATNAAISGVFDINISLFGLDVVA